MGMSASQARLLSLTARLHDVELQAQNIMSQKIALATQKDALYQDYCDALEASSIKVAYWDGAAGTTFVDANYSTLCNFDKNRVKQYALKDNMTGNLIVSEEVKRGSYAGEISAQIAEELFDELDAPVERVCGLNIVSPFSPVLEDLNFPHPEDIAKAVKRVLNK